MNQILRDHACKVKGRKFYLHWIFLKVLITDDGDAALYHVRKIGLLWVGEGNEMATCREQKEIFTSLEEINDDVIKIMNSLSSEPPHKGNLFPPTTICIKYQKYQSPSKPLMIVIPTHKI